MICSTRAPSQMLAISRRIAAELANDALDRGANLTMADRMALATLSLAVDAEASRRAGVEPITGARDEIAEGLALIEATSMKRENVDASLQPVASVDQPITPINPVDLG